MNAAVLWFAVGCHPHGDDPFGLDSMETTADSADTAPTGDSTDSAVDSRDSDTTPCTKTAWYRDADGDGFGDAAVAEFACTAPEGFVADASDCDDLHAAAYTGAAEQATDGLDNDCDGTMSVTSVADVPVWQAHGPNSGAGMGSNVAVGDFNNDGMPDLALGGTSVSVDDSFRGAPVWVLAGPLSAIKAPVDETTTVASFYSTWGAGPPALCNLGDLDGDGAEDLVVGAPASGGHSEGSALIAHGPLDGLIDLTVDSGTLFGAEWGEALGLCAAPGDVDGDGIPDVVLSAYGTSSSATADGRVYVLRGPAEVESVAEADQVLQGEQEYEKVGYALSSLGDLNGDGVGDYSVGNGNDIDLYDGLSTYLVTDYVPGVMHPRDVGVTIHFDLSTMGSVAASRIGDVNGDGYNDVAIGGGNPYDGVTDSLSVLEGELGSASSLQLSKEAAITFESSEGGTNEFLSFATTLGDWNGDGSGALAIGAPMFAKELTEDCAETTSRCSDGAVFLVAEPIDPGVYDLAMTADRIVGSYPAGQMGGGAWGGGLQGDTDFDGDGTPDLVFAAPLATTETGGNAGSAYVLFGPGAH